jgi:hypothetical protein
MTLIDPEPVPEFTDSISMAADVELILSSLDEVPPGKYKLPKRIQTPTDNDKLLILPGDARPVFVDVCFPPS